MDRWIYTKLGINLLLLSLFFNTQQATFACLAMLPIWWQITMDLKTRVAFNICSDGRGHFADLSIRVMTWRF